MSLLILPLSHSAKGSTWEEHKYIKRIDGTYYYPDSYEGGRHLNSDQKSKNDEPPELGDLTDADIETLAKEVIRGNFANGQDRKELLGAYYQKIQDRVNQLLKSSSGSKKVSELNTETNSKTVETGKAAVSSAAKKGMDMNQIYSVYKKKR